MSTTSGKRQDTRTVTQEVRSTSTILAENNQVIIPYDFMVSHFTISLYSSIFLFEDTIIFILFLFIKAACILCFIFSR